LQLSRTSQAWPFAAFLCCLYCCCCCCCCHGAASAWHDNCALIACPGCCCCCCNGRPHAASTVSVKRLLVSACRAAAGTIAAPLRAAAYSCLSPCLSPCLMAAAPAGSASLSKGTTAAAAAAYAAYLPRSQSHGRCCSGAATAAVGTSVLNCCWLLLHCCDSHAAAVEKICRQCKGSGDRTGIADIGSHNIHTHATPTLLEIIVCPGTQNAGVCALAAHRKPLSTGASCLTFMAVAGAKRGQLVCRAQPLFKGMAGSTRTAT
jgi:hypothetical protein